MSSSGPTTGLLYVTMNPKPSLGQAAFNDWYNNEHGPTRLRLPFIKTGFRYRATDSTAYDKSQPEWMALYDISDMAELTKESYMRLRSQPVKTQREADTMAQIDVDRKLFDMIGKEESETQPFKFEKIDEVEKGNTIVSIILLVEKDKVDEVDQWYTKNILTAIKETSGWRASGRYQTASIDQKKDGKAEYLIIHEFTPGTDVQTLNVLSKLPFDTEKPPTIRYYNLYYTFGSAARHLSQISSWRATDPLNLVTKTIPASNPDADFGAAIESIIYTPDNFPLHYRIEGSSDPNAPVIICCNSILVTWGIWDTFVESFFEQHPDNKKYRIVRYLSRGRTPDLGSTSPITIDLLAQDAVTLLTELRVQTAELIIGVSQGGATAIAAGVNYPDRFQNFIACDTSMKSPAGNKDTWATRIEVAEKEGSTAKLVGPFGDVDSTKVDTPEHAIVGEQLAELTVRRWFTQTSYDTPSIVPFINEVKNMVYTNSLEGFKASVAALYEYDYVEKVKTYPGPGRGGFLVGAGDGALPKGMEAMSAQFAGDKGIFHVVEDAGHLPMVEKPDDVAGFVSQFLKG